LSRFFRLAVAVALTAFILWKADPAQVLRTTAGADWRWIGAAVALTLLDRTLMAYRWMVLLCSLSPGSRPPFGAVLRIFFVSTFVGTFLPSVGGDLYRAYSLSRMHVSGVQAAASVLMDRLLGVLSIVLVGVVALLGAQRLVSIPGIWIILVLASVMCLGAAMTVFSERVARMGQAITARMPTQKAKRLGTGLIDAVRRYSQHHGELTSVLAMSIAVQVIRVVQAYCLGEALGLDAPIWVYFAFIPTILLIMQLPITVAGLGTSQVAFAWLFGAVGVPAAAAVALSILFVALGIVGNLPGALLYAFGGGRERQPT
jgi:glycosyltransferase 2 family protein